RWPKPIRHSHTSAGREEEFAWPRAWPGCLASNGLYVDETISEIAWFFSMVLLVFLATRINDRHFGTE
ncbi:hypothetical protein OAF50_03740, partial [bacterium]|nr:hypothetical protein [bacterium]